jgi:hypothetical protein
VTALLASALSALLAVGKNYLTISDCSFRNGNARLEADVAAQVEAVGDMVG